MPENSKTREAPQIPDHSLVRRIGVGSYGEVWLARNVMGTYRAVKIIHRKNFSEERPFAREFEGIQRFEPISRHHPGLVAILHIGKNESSGYFYYVMEVADDLVSGPAVDPATYTVKTLSSTLDRGGRLPLPECFGISLALVSALEYIHDHGLIHRDIKPSNIIFVNGAPKFADIGLVTKAGRATYVGSPGYMPPEGPGSPTADIFSLGKVFYELFMGKSGEEFPELPSRLEELGDVPTLMRINEVILRACNLDARKRLQSARELHKVLTEITSGSLPAPRTGTLDGRVVAPPRPSSPATVAPFPIPPPTLKVTVLYKANAQPDGQVLELLRTHLPRRGCEVFIDQHLPIGVAWARAIEAAIRHADAVAILLSAASVQSEMLACEVELAHQASQQQQGRPRLLPVRIRHTDPLPGTLGTLLHPLQYFLWEGSQDNEKLLNELVRALETSQKAAPPADRLKLESIGGAVPLDSRFYVERPTDSEFQTAIDRRDSIVLVKGARQMGKTSLLARGLQEARQSGAQVVLADLQKLNASHLVSVESFFLALGEFLSEQLDLSVLPAEFWDKRRSPNPNFERFIRQEVLEQISQHLVWGLDEVDRLFTCDFGSEVFGLLRSWHNERALDPTGPWSRLTLALAYATEAHLFITDVNQSPFNVGTRLALDDFTFEQVADLHHRYGSPLPTEAQLRRFYQLLGGQPYLVRRGFNELAAGHVNFEDFLAHADRDEGLFGDHLRRMLVLLAKDPDLTEVVRSLLRGQPCLNVATFYRLRSAGLLKGDSPQDACPRCEVYEKYLKRHLL